MNGSIYNQIRVFHVIAKEKSISGAARTLSMATPSVSQSLKALEQHLGLPLFTRTTRKIELTEAGQLLYQRTNESLQSLNIAIESVGDLAHKPRGKIRLTAPRFVFQHMLAPIYAEFCACYPEIELEISLNDGTVDILEEGFDVGIRFGNRISQGMIARPLIPPQKDALFASPDYLKKWGTPESIQDLHQHRLIRYRFITSNQLLPLSLIQNGKPITLDVKTALVVNDTDVMKDAAIQGIGIGRLIRPLVQDAFNSGILEPVLEKHWTTASGLFVYFHQNTQKAKRVRTLIDFLMSKIHA